MVEQQIIFRGETIRYHVNFNHRRKTRTLIRIRADGGVLVDAPVSVNLLQIREWVRSRADWLLRRRGEIARERGFISPLRYRDGEDHLFLGETYRLEVCNGKRPAIALDRDDGMLRVRLADRDGERVRKYLWRWYREQAAGVFAQRLEAMAATVPWLDGQPELKQRRMRRRWGSCSAQGLITLNTHLIKARPVLIDYVILHELCHLREHNHGSRFYALLEQLLPHWRCLKQELDEQADFIVNE